MKFSQWFIVTVFAISNNSGNLKSKRKKSYCTPCQQNISLVTIVYKYSYYCSNYGTMKTWGKHCTKLWFTIEETVELHTNLPAVQN